MYLFIDTETNGLIGKFETDKFKKYPRIVQLAWALYDEKGFRKSLNSFIVFPSDFTISDESAAIHGITMDKAMSEGILLKNVLNRFNYDIDKCSDVVAHNLEFDLPVIITEFERMGISTSIGDKQKFCTMVDGNVTNYCRIPFPYGDGYKWPTLSELHIRLFNKDFPGSHNAVADVEACAKCYFELKESGVIAGDEVYEW